MEALGNEEFVVFFGVPFGQLDGVFGLVMAHLLPEGCFEVHIEGAPQFSQVVEDIGQFMRNGFGFGSVAS